MPQRKVARSIQVRIYEDEKHLYLGKIDLLELLHGGASNAMKALIRKYEGEQSGVQKPVQPSGEK